MIRQVRISNYKSLGDVSVDLDPVTVLIGRSGSGKTNFVEALRFLRDYLLNRGEGNVMTSQGGWERILCATAAKPAKMSFMLRFGAPGVTEDYQYLLSFQQHPSQPGSPLSLREERLSLGNRVFFHQEQGQWPHPPATAHLPKPGAVVLGTLTGIPEDTIAYLVLTNGLGCYGFPDNILMEPKAGTKPHETGLSDKGENYRQVFSAITLNLQAWQYPKEMVAAMQQVDPSTKAVDLSLPGRNRLVVSHGVNGRLLVFDLNQESEGFRRFFAHLIALYQTPPKQTLIFEEPEKGIHPGALAALADQFKACARSGRGQVLLTTHSPELLDHFDADQIRVVEMQDYLTRIGPAAPEQLEAVREQLLRPGELLTVDPARLAAEGVPSA